MDDLIPPTAPQPSTGPSVEGPAPAPLSSPSGDTGHYRPASSDPLVELQHLRRAVASLPLIEQAKGMIMLRYGVDANAAFALLQRWSQNSNTKLVRICKTVVDVASRPGGGSVLDQLLASRPFDSRVEDARPGYVKEGTAQTVDAPNAP